MVSESLDMKGCICHFVMGQIHPFLSKETINNLNNLPVSIFSASVLVLSTLNRYLLIRHCIVSAYVVVFVSSVLADSNSRFMFSRRRCHKQTHHHHRISVGLQRVYSHSMTIVQNFLFICYSLIIIIC